MLKGGGGGLHRIVNDSLLPFVVFWSDVLIKGKANGRLVSSSWGAPQDIPLEDILFWLQSRCQDEL